MTNPFASYLLNRVVFRTALVLGIVIFGGMVLAEKVWRLDLTEDQRFTISDASRRIVSELEDPLTIRAYFSSGLPPRYEPFQQQVFDILDEYRAHGRGNVKIERFDPDESQAARDDAKNYNIQPVQLPVLEATSVQVLKVYGSIVLLYRDRSSEVIDVAVNYQQGYEGLSGLEYAITSRIWQLSHDRPKLAITGNLTRPAPARFPGAPPQGQEQPEFQGLRRLLGESFEVSEVDLDQEAPDPAKIPLLLVVRPKEFSEVALFRLDQYLMKGGRVLLFITQGTLQQQPFGQGRTYQNVRFEGPFEYQPFSTGLDAWLEHNGIRVPNEFVVQRMNARSFPVDRVLQGRIVVRGNPEPFWFWPIISSEFEGAINQENPAVQTLRQVIFYWPHPVELLDSKLGKDLHGTVLVQSHAGESWRWKDLSRVDYRALNPEEDLAEPARVKPSPLAVSVEGKFTSFFADHPVPPSLTEASDKEKEGEDGAKPAEDGTDSGDADKPAEGADKPAAKGPEVVKESVRDTNLVVVGNAFFLSDPVIGGQQADENSRRAILLAINLADWLARSSDLIALRAKKYADRALVEKESEEEFDRIKKEYDEGNMTPAEAAQALDRADEARKQSRKRLRWLNVLLPCMVVLVAGCLVWILRSALRSKPPGIPPAAPPLSVRAGEHQTHGS